MAASFWSEDEPEHSLVETLKDIYASAGLKHRRDGVALELRKDALRRARGGRFCPPRLRATLPQAGAFSLRSS